MMNFGPKVVIIRLDRIIQYLYEKTSIMDSPIKSWNDEEGYLTTSRILEYK
jgi:hypothetical protein